MPARILVVDDVPANLRLLEARLTAERFDVITVENGQAAIEMMKMQPPDLVLLDVMMPGMNGFEVCKKIRSTKAIADIPVVMITASSEPVHRSLSLEAGADDFLTKPINDMALLARTKSLVHLKKMIDELYMRESTMGQFYLMPTIMADEIEDIGPGRILLIHENNIWVQKITDALQEAKCQTTHMPSLDLVYDKLTLDDDYNVIILSVEFGLEEILKLIAYLRVQENTRPVPIILTGNLSDIPQIVKALENGGNDYFLKPIEREEVLLRVRTQVRRSYYQERLRILDERNVSNALVDHLTGLYNEHYIADYLKKAFAQFDQNNKPLSIMIVNVDNFYEINKNCNPQVAEALLHGLIRRMQVHIHSPDFIGRLSEDKFILVMPDTTLQTAQMLANRLYKMISKDEIIIDIAPHKLPTAITIVGSCITKSFQTADAFLNKTITLLDKAKKVGNDPIIFE
ncbi:MAG: response regulator [Alphaproteobacteria bacterium]|nr:response regulator [Alphaproteobacteria bacterium]